MTSLVPEPIACWISTADLETPSDKTSSTCPCSLRMAAAAFLPCTALAIPEKAFIAAPMAISGIGMINLF